MSPNVTERRRVSPNIAERHRGNISGRHRTSPNVACAGALEKATEHVVQVTAGIAVARGVSPDHYGLGERPSHAPQRRVHSGASVARQAPNEPDPDDYIDAWTKPPRGAVNR